MHKLLCKSKIFSICKENFIHNGWGVSLCYSQVSDLPPGAAFTSVKVSLHCFLSDQVAACITVPEGCEHFQSIFRNQGSFVVWQVLKTEVFINYQEYELQQILQGAFESGGS